MNEQGFWHHEADRGRAEDALDIKGAYKLGGEPHLLSWLVVEG